MKIATGHEIKHKADLFNAGDAVAGIPVSTKLGTEALHTSRHMQSSSMLPSFSDKYGQL